MECRTEREGMVMADLLTSTPEILLSSFITFKVVVAVFFSGHQ